MELGQLWWQAWYRYGLIVFALVFAIVGANMDGEMLGPIIFSLAGMTVILGLLGAVSVQGWARRISYIGALAVALIVALFALLVSYALL